MRKVSKESVQNTLDNVKKVAPELSDLILQNADARCGKKVALAKKGDMGTISVKTDFLTYPEMNIFLLGYLLKSENMFAKL